MESNNEKKDITANWNQHQLPRIDFEKGSFDANGTTYYIETDLTIGRYCEFQILQRELAMGMTLQQIYDGLVNQKKLLNQTRFADAVIHVNDQINHCAKLKEKEPVALKICTLFINERDEDRSKWGNDIVVKKLNDWRESGINVNDFFQLAFTLIPGYTNIYNLLIQNITEQMGVAKGVVDAMLEQ